MPDTYDPHGPTPVRIGERETTLAQLRYRGGQYRFAREGSVVTVTMGWLRVPAGAIVHRDTERKHGDTSVHYWIEESPADPVFQQTIQDFPYYDP